MFFTVAFSTSLKNFQEVEKGYIGNEWLKLFSMEIAFCFFLSCANLLTIFTRSLWKSFVIVISSSVFSLFSTNLIVVLALTLFEKRGLTICQNFLLSDIKFTSRFVKFSFFDFFQEVYAKVSLFFVLFSRHLWSIAQKLISKSRMFHSCLV